MTVPGRERSEPWWASGAADLSPEPDPLGAYRRSRADAVHDVHGDEGDRVGHGPADELSRSAVEDAIDGLAALARAAGRRARREGRLEGLGDGRRDEHGRGRHGDPQHGDGEGGRGHDPACRGCPWCTLLRSLGDARPEVTEHLEAAARHVVLAARAWVDAAEARTGWERIPLDDEDEEARVQDRGDEERR